LPNPTPAPPPARPEPTARPRCPWPLRLWRFGDGLCRHAWRGFLTLLCVLLYLWLIGVPGFLVNRWLRQLDEHHVRVVLNRVRLDPTAGLVADGVFLYRADDYSEPMARLQRAILHPDLHALRRGSLGLKAVTVEDGYLRLPPLPRSNLPPVRVTARAIAGRIEVYPDRIQLAPLRATMFGIQWESTGAVARVAQGPGIGFWTHLNNAWAALGRAPAAVADVAAELNGLRFDPPPRAQVGFAYNPVVPQGWTVHVTATGRDAEIRGASFDAVQADLLIAGYELQLRDITLGAAGKRGILSGRLNLASRQAEARLYSDLPPQPWIAMMPRSWQDELVAIGLRAEGSMKSEIWIGPAPLDQLARNLHGWISLERAEIRGIPLEKGYASLRVSGDTLQVEDISAIVGRAAGRGPFEGRFTWQRATHEVDGELKLQFDPNLALPILSSNQARLVRRFTFPAQPPGFSGEFRRTGGTQRTLRVSGLVTAADCTYREVALTSIVATLTVDQRVISLKPWVFRRPEGSVSGELHYDTEKSLITVDLAGDMSPHAVAGLVSPGLQRVLSPTCYEGPVFAHAYGVVDGRRSDHRTDLRVRVEGQRLGVTNWLADSAQLDLHVLGNTYVTTNVSGVAFGGPFTAEVRVGPGADRTTLFYQVTAQLTNAELPRVVTQVRSNAIFEGTGRVRLTARVEGPVHDPGFRLMTGSGEAHIERGEVMRLPVFGGLSRLLSTIYPGLGFAAQNDLHAKFRLREGRIVTDDARLEGMVISMKLAGYYAFDGKLRFNVEVQLLRKGPIARVLRFITMPVTKLLVFQLSGTLNDPHWRPVNLPKELFLIFE
jgi:hypothetical protein